MGYRSLTEESVHRLDSALTQTGEALMEFMHIHMNYRGQMIPSELIDIQDRLHSAHANLRVLRDKHFGQLTEEEGKAYYGDTSHCHECNRSSRVDPTDIYG